MADRADSAGFTLLEVLAAAVIMAAIYGVLAASNIDATILEGDADRRLHASLIADRVLADLETEIVLGNPPPLGQREDEEDGYAIEVEIAPLELPLDAWLPEPEDAPLRDARAPSLLTPPGRGDPPLRKAEVTVAWNDGVADRFVKRVTFVFDAAVASGVLQQAGVDPGAAPGNAATGGDGTPFDPSGPPQ